jgi:uncharacterized protein YunC (DUF1805 family)
MKEVDIRWERGMALGFEFEFPNASLVFAQAPRGYVMCGYLNMNTANMLGDIAAVVRGVNTVDELLAAKVQEVSDAAAKLGVKIGMTGKEALEKMM